MSEFQFGGFGLPIPESADVDSLDPHIHPNLPVQTIVLVDGEPFRKADWAHLGYTNYEVWCVGGAGGQGGDAARKLYWPRTHNREVMPPSVFTAWKEGLLYTSWPGYQGITGYNYPGAWTTEAAWRAHYYLDSYWHTYVPGERLPPVGSSEYEDYRLFGGWNIYTTYFTFDQRANYYSSLQSAYLGWADWKAAGQPAPHLGWRQTFGTPLLLDDGAAIGGAGGGGGVHKVVGLLSDLPDEVSVMVGSAGLDAQPGHMLSNGAYTPSIANEGFLYDGEGGVLLGSHSSFNHPELYEATYRDWANVYNLPHPTFYPPAAGQDGGASSFGDICKASGGKGGGPSVIWVAGQLHFHAHGGDGGKGGTLVAGGGGSGSTLEASGVDLWPLPGKDGTWDGAIGTGGGGGRGGSSYQSYKYMYSLADGSTINVENLPSVGFQIIHNRNGSNGGLGAWSRADTSVYTEGGPRESMTHQTVYGGSLAHSASGMPSYSIDQIAEPIVPFLDMFPGAGGGARVNRKYYVGSYRSKMDARYSPHGFVLIRLSKVGD